MRPLLIATFALLCAACAPSTKFQSNWQDPAYAAGPLKHLAVFVIGAKDTTRRVAEDEIVAQLPPGANAVASYKLFPEQAADRDLVVKTLRDKNFDSALIIKLTGLKEDEIYYPPQVDYVPVHGYGGYGGYYGAGFGGYYGTTYQQMYTPGYVQTTTTALVEYVMYALDKPNPVWMATTSTFDPQSPTKGSRSVAKVIGKELKKRALLAP